MIRNLLKISWRSLWKNKVFTLINISGLALGLTCCYLIILFSTHEFSYDRFHQDVDRIFRVEYGLQLSSDVSTGRIPPTVAPLLVDYFPEIESAARFYPRDLSVELTKNGEQFEMEDVFFVDSTVIHVFSLDFLQGSAKRAFRDPKSVVVTEATAKKLFGVTDVVGSSLKLAGEDGFFITGVVKEWPDHAHLEFTMLLPYEAMIAVEPIHARAIAKWVIENNWIATHSFSYVKLFAHARSTAVDAKFPAFIQEYGDERFRDKQSFSLIPVQNIHLYSAEGGPKPPGNLDYLYLFLAVGTIILFIACINFINLSTANSMSRAKEVGVRKVLGAERSALMRQFLGESFLQSLVSFLIAIGLVKLTLPYLNDLTGLEIQYHIWLRPWISLAFVGIFVLSGILAGIYPAFIVTNYNPASVLRGSVSVGENQSNPWFRKALITFQFVAAIGFIAGACIVYLQLRHLQDRYLGFDQDLVMNVPLNSGNNINAVFRPGDSTLRQRMNTFDEILVQHPKITAVTQSYRPPGLGAVGRNVWNEHTPQSDNFFARVLSVDYDYVETFDLTLLAGRDFDQSFGTDHLSSFLVNEQAATALGWKDAESAIGGQMVLEGKEGQVVGVLKDFNFASLHLPIDPLVMEVRPGAFAYFSLKTQVTDLSQTLQFVEEKWREFFPEKVFEYTFLDESIGEAYVAEQRLAKIIGYFSFIAIFIASFGLFGLAALMTRRRFKEIGIRKVLGASTWQILKLVAADFLQLIVLALFIAAPLAWYFLDKWLSDFAYRVNFPWWMMIGSGLLVLMVAFLTVSSQSIRAALSNPVESIRDE